MTLETDVSVKEFCKVAGISVSRLYALFHRNAGPPRVITHVDGQLQPTVKIPLHAGLVWQEERLRNAHPNHIATGQMRKEAATRERERRARNRARLRQQLSASPLYNALTTAKSAVESQKS